MIDIIEDLIDWTKEVDGVKTVYLTYPQTKTLAKDKLPMVIIAHAGHRATFQVHEEIIAEVIYTVEVFADTQTSALSIARAVSDKYADRNGVTNGLSVAYDNVYRRYSAVFSVTFVVDRRGALFQTS